MTQPIDIPVKKRRHQRPFLEKCLFPEEEGPYLGYIEIFESGHIYRALSSGSGKFVEVGSRCTLPTLAFIVEKDRSRKRITLDIVSLSLRQAVSRAILNDSPSLVSPDLDFDTILKHYDALKAHLQQLRVRWPFDDVTLEMRLLVEDLLLERALYDGIGMEVLRQRQILCVPHLQDIHARHISIGLNEIEACFSLGLVPDEMDQGYLEALNNRFAELARSGDYTELRNLCEPVVRSGEIELQYNPALLLDVLDNGYLDVYQYMLDLVDRTKQSSLEILDPQYVDVTYDPLYVAIQLGQLNTVRAFVSEHATFEGYVFEGTTTDPDRIFTPLLAAVYWQRADILRLLLQSGPIYFAGLPQASAMAVETGSLEVLEVLMEHHSQSTTATVVNDVYPPSTFSQSQFSISPQNLQYSGTATGHSPLGMGKSVSGITNGLSGFDTFMQPPAQSFSSEITNNLSLVIPSEVSENLHLQTPTIFVESEPPDPSNPPDPLGSLAYLEQSALPPIRRTVNHNVRRQLGREFSQRLEATCMKLARVCSNHLESKEYVRVSQYFDGIGSAWTSGIDSFRQITRNKAPAGLIEVLQSLFVADALICQLPHANGGLEIEFKNDLGRWRTLLRDSEQPVFDEIVCSVWDIDTVTTLDVPKNGPAELYRFQKLIQNLVSLDDFTDQLPSKSNSSGTRLRTIQRQVGSRKRNRTRIQSRRQIISPDGSFQSIGSVLGRLTKDTDSFYEEEVDLADFIHLDALGGEPAIVTPPVPNEGSPDSSQWKDIEPMVVLLLASVAFSVVLTAVSAIQDGPQECRSRGVRQGSPGYGRSCAIVEDFLSFKTESTIYDSGVDVRTPRESRLSPWLWEMKEASQTNSRLQPLTGGEVTGAGSPTLAVPGSMSSPSGSSFVMTDVSSPDTARSALRRIKCLSCPKTFSSVSNRNKHMREGCALRDKKGYRCRNGSCTKVLTTKWYRNTHESTRCRFRREKGLGGEVGE